MLELVWLNVHHYCVQAGNSQYVILVVYVKLERAGVNRCMCQRWGPWRIRSLAPCVGCARAAVMSRDLSGLKIRGSVAAAAAGAHCAAGRQSV